MGSITDFQNIIIPTTGERLNEESFVHYMKSLKTIEISEFNPPSWLNHLESPLEWIQVLPRETLFKSDVDKKLQDYPKEDNDGTYTFEKFCLHLAKVCQNVLMKNHKDSVLSLQQLKSALNEISRNNSDDMYLRIRTAFEHVLLVFEAHILYLNNELNEEDFNNSKIYSNLKMSLSKMEPKVKAGIEAIKGRFYLSITSDTNMAKSCMKKAIELDPEFHAWIYWTGKIIRKIGKDNFNRDLEEELYYFKSAVEKKGDPKYLLYLAQCYREIAKCMHMNKSNYDEQNRFNELSSKLYRECWELKKDSAAINKRLGNGIMSLYWKYADYDLAEEVLLSALNISKHPVIFHILGGFYSKYKQDYSNAIKYYTKGAENGLHKCFNELIRLKYIMCSPEYDPYNDLKKEETAAEYSMGLWIIYCDLLWYYLSIKPDLPKAINYFFLIEEIRREKEDYTWLTKFRCYTFLLDHPVNICAILKGEVNMRQAESNAEFERLNHFFSENLNRHENEDPSLASIKDEILKIKQDKRQRIEGSFLKNHHLQSNWKKPVRPESEVYKRETNVNYKPKKTAMSVDQKREPINNQSYRYAHNQRTCSDRNKTENWRAECRANEFVTKVPNVKK